MSRRFWWFLVVQTTVVGWGTAETAVAVPRQGFGQHVDHPLRACLLLWATFTCCLLSLVRAAYCGEPLPSMCHLMRGGGLCTM